MTEYVDGPGHSDSINEIAPALVAAQGQLVSPRRNRSVRVKTKSGPEYTFRYTTLDAINDMIREPLAANGLCITQRLVQTRPPTLVTRLLHVSGQWIETSMPVQPTNNDPQALGAAITYVRRYSIVALLNISSDEDDDGAAASGRVSQPVVPQDTLHAVAERFRRLIEAARRVHKDVDVVPLLKLWQRDMEVFTDLRNNPDRAEQWTLLVTDMPAAISRAMGDSFGNAWKAGLLATKRSDLVEMRKSWDGEWSVGAQFAKKAWPQAYAMLAEHMRAQAARVEATAEEEEVLAETPPEPPAPEPEPEPPFYWALRDEVGDVISEPFERPIDFLRAFSDVPFGVEEAEQNLNEHNSEALAACRKDTSAAVVALFKEIDEPAEAVEVIELKRTRSGAAGFVDYLAAARLAIGQLSAVGIDVWVEANAPTYTTLPQGSKMQVLKAIAERRLKV